MRTAALSLFVLAVLAAGCGKTTPSGAPAPTPGGADEGQKLQGVWRVESWEMLKTPPPSEDEQKQAKLARFVFHNDRLAVLVPTEPRDVPLEKIPPRVSLFTIDAGADPKVLKLSKVVVGAGHDGVLGDDRAEWVYKLEGDALVIAATDFGAAPARPAEFKATTATPDKPGVEVVRLKKSNEEVPGWLKNLTVRTLEPRGGPPKK